MKMTSLVQDCKMQLSKCSKEKISYMWRYCKMIRRLEAERYRSTYALLFTICVTFLRLTDPSDLHFSPL